MELRWGIVRVVFDRRWFIVLLVITTAFTFLGPFGTYQDFNFISRLGYWAIVNAGVGLFISTASDTLFAPGIAKSMSRPAKTILASALGATGGSVVVWLAANQLRGTWPNPFYIWFCVFVICAVIIAVRLQLWIPEPRTFAKFFKRLPPELGIDLISLSMADHYVEARTANGSTMILMRFADALKELGDFPGARIHRSHWVSASHAKRLIREGRQHALVLEDGSQLPVSKAYVASVRDMLDRKLDQRLDQIGQGSPANQSAS